MLCAHTLLCLPAPAQTLLALAGHDRKPRPALSLASAHHRLLQQPLLLRPAQLTNCAVHPSPKPYLLLWPFTIKCAVSLEAYPLCFSCLFQRPRNSSLSFTAFYGISFLFFLHTLPRVCHIHSSHSELFIYGRPFFAETAPCLLLLWKICEILCIWALSALLTAGNSAQRLFA